MKTKLNMIGGGFTHDFCSSGYNTPKHVEWVKDRSANISIYIDRAMFSNPDPSKRNFAWVAESSVIIPDVIQRLKRDYNSIAQHYEAIFTHDKRLLSIGPKMKFAIANACPWVQDRKVHPKTKLTSMIVSNKHGLPGYNYRLSWVEKMKGKIDIYGRNIKTIDKKEEGLVDYMFSFAMENSNYPSIFCEKLTDCLATGTIPIFWGTPDIGEWFNEDGIITLTDDFDYTTLTEELYYSKIEAVKDNFQRAIDLPTAEDYFYLNYIA